MRSFLRLAPALFFISLALTGCGGGTGGGGSTTTYKYGVQISFLNAAGTMEDDIGGETVYYVSGSKTSFTQNALLTSPSTASVFTATNEGNAIYDALFTTDGPETLSFAISYANDEDCPQSLNGGGTGTYVYDNSLYYPGPENQPITCNTNITDTVSPVSTSSSSPASQITLTLAKPVSSVYGTPQLYVFDEDGNAYGNEAVSSVSSDGKTVTAGTTLIPTNSTKTYVLGVAEIQANGSSISMGGALFNMVYVAPPPNCNQSVGAGPNFVCPPKT